MFGTLNVNILLNNENSLGVTNNPTVLVPWQNKNKNMEAKHN